MAYQINSIDYGDYRYSVGDTIKISPSAEYMYWSISNTGTTSTPGISAEVRKIAQIWQEDSTGSTVYNPILTEFVSGSTGYGTGFIRPEQIVVGSGGLKVKNKVTYNANGGYGAPGQQIKVYGSILTLSSTKPTRTGYTFLKWNTNTSGTGTSYSPGQQYGDDADITLYAIWTPVIYTVSFNANGGSGAPGAQTKTYGIDLTLSSTKPTRTNYNFKGWGTNSSSTSALYQPGGTYRSNANITLYAIWELAYIKPRITSVSAERCDSTGKLTDEGTYAKIYFKWNCDKTVSSIKITVNSITTSVSASGTSGSVSKIVGSGELLTELTYSVVIEVSDSNGSSSTNAIVSPMFYTMDFMAGGRGIAFGKPASEQDVVEFGTSIYMDIGKPIFFKSADAYPPNTLAAGLKSKNGYYGLCIPTVDGVDDATYIRTPGQGISPYGPGGTSSIGTEYWPFYSGHFNYLNIIGMGSRIAILTFNTDRAWHFEPYGTGSSEQLWLTSTTNKTFGIHHNNTDTTITFNPEIGEITLGHNGFIRNSSNQHLYLFASDEPNYGVHLGVHDSQWTFDPDASNRVALGTANHLWTSVYASSGTINTSDRNQKTDIEEVPQKYEDIFFELKPVIYRLKEGQSGRIHTGFISQDIEESLLRHNMSTMDWAAVCKDKDTTGETDVYSLRYSEIISLNTLMVQKAHKKISVLQNEISKLKREIYILKGGE